MLANINKNQNGYTLAELNISIVILSTIMLGIFAIFTNYFVLLTRNNIILSMNVSSQSLLRTVTEELRYGAGVRQTNTISDANGPGGGWNTNNTNFVVITAIPAVTTGGDYIIDVATGKPYLNEYVYYKQGTVMYKRILANPGATGNSIKTSCPVAIASTSCPEDRELIDNVSSMTFTLFDQDNVSTTDPLLARSIKINLSLSRDTFGQPLTLDNSIRTTLRNQF